MIRTYEAPILRKPPAYRPAFCSVCGSPVPLPRDGFPLLEIPAGTLDDDPGIRPDKHLIIGPKSSWFEITDDLPRMSGEQLVEYRRSIRFGQ